MRRRLLDPWLRPHGIAESFFGVEDRVRDLEISPREGDVTQIIHHSGGGSGGGGGAGVTDHGALTGLSDDDHPQYATDTDLSNHVAAADPHTGYVREADANWIDLTDGGATTLHSHAGGGGGTLDSAYDFGGAGAGRTINATDGAVVITSTEADTAFLLEVTPTPGSSAALGGISITVGANSTEAALKITQSGSGPAIDIIGSDTIRFNSTGPTLHSSTGDDLALTGDLDISGNLAVGPGRAISATQIITAGTNATITGTANRIIEMATAATLNANSTSMVGIRVSGTSTGTGFTGLQYYGINFASVVSGGTWSVVTALRGMVAPFGIVTTYKGLDISDPGDPSSGSGTAYGVYIDVPQGANWSARRGLTITGVVANDVLAQYVLPVASFDDPQCQLLAGARVVTTNATVTTLTTIPIPRDTCVQLIVHVTARRTAGSAGTAGDVWSYIIAATFRNRDPGGGYAAAVVAQTALHTGEDQAGFACVFDANGEDARVRVTGAANNTVTWHASKVEYEPVAN
jgi:hypothetical protein